MACVRFYIVQCANLHWLKPEIEYADKVSQAVDVPFKVTDPKAVARAFNLDQAEDAALVIWTTTVWTLPANRCIAYGPDIEYAAVRTAKGLLVVASQLVPACLERWGIAGEVVGTAQGASLEGLVTQHPFYDREAPVHPGEHVTVAEGTGLVHTAPAHGEEDFALGLQHGYDATSPVDTQCRFHNFS